MVEYNIGMNVGIAIYGVITLAYIASLIAFLLKVGLYRNLDSKRRSNLKVVFVGGGIAMVYMTYRLVMRFL